VLATVLWVGVLTAAFNVVLTSQLHAQSGSLLRQRATAATAELQVFSDGSVHLAEPADDEALDVNLWIYSGRRALERPRAGTLLQARADALADSGERFAQYGGDSPVRLFALPVRAKGRQVATVVSGLSLDPYEHVARLALGASIGLAGLLLVGVYGASRLVIGRALAPVQQMSAQAARWSATDAAQRFGRSPRPAELALLARNLDGVLDRLEALLRHEQQVTEELSHELRTPLSLIVAEADLAGSKRRTLGELHEALARIGAGAAHMQSILETLLTAARTRSPDSAGRCVLRAAVDAAVAQQPPGAGPAVFVSGDAGIVAAVDSDVVERILAPLLDNAARYARQRTDITLRGGPIGVVVSIRDDGPGVAPALTDSIFEPGRRDAESSPHGAGLGLALARRLARAAGGDLALVDGAFELRLPGADNLP
jgi:signal transduction histidine kinase